ncbi:hypothetical protein, partial [Burkholderia thailandensis]|uniref:hypothetical protein n=1 Tax=Burkholderia thailandensis TaxID=57975 RepID=UPI00217D0B17
MLSPQPDGVRWFNYTVPTVALPELAPPGGSIVEMFAPVDPRLRGRRFRIVGPCVERRAGRRELGRAGAPLRRRVASADEALLSPRSFFR